MNKGEYRRFVVEIIIIKTCVFPFLPFSPYGFSSFGATCRIGKQASKVL